MAYHKTGGEYTGIIKNPYMATWIEMGSKPTGQKFYVVNDYIIGSVDGTYKVVGKDTDTIGNAIKDASLTLTTGLSSAISAVTSTASNTTDSISSMLKSFDSSGTGQGLSNTVSSFGANLFNNSSNTADGGTFNIGKSLGLDGGLGNALGSNTSDLAKSIGSATASVSKSVTSFIAPINDVASSLQNIGKEFDKIIKDTFLGQIFNIKGSEILCTLFCIIVSMLSCSDRQALYDTIVQIRQGIKNANAVIQNINDMTKSPVEVPLFNDKTISDNIKSLFGSQLQGKDLDKFLNINPDGSTKTKSITPSTFEIPPSVLSTIQIIVKVLSVLAKGQITVPVGLSGSGGIWDFAKTVLMIIQSVIIQMVDEFLTNYINKLEKMLKDMMPQICIGNLASAFINKIINATKSVKDFLLSQVRALLKGQDGFGIKWKKFGWYFKEIQELLAMLKALELILKNFADLALACGVSPCTEGDQATTQEIKNAINNGELIDQTNEPATILVNDLPLFNKQTPDLDRIVPLFKDMTSNPNTCLSQTDGGFCVVMPDMFKDAPTQIKNLTSSPEFLTYLGDAYSVYNTDNKITVVYTYSLKTGNI